MVFDYWRDGKEDADPEFPEFLDEIDLTKKLYVFVSHFHKDHFNRAIFGWAARFPKVEYLVSRDVYKRCRHILSPTSVYSGPKVSADRVHVLREGEEWSSVGIDVHAFGSTDIGVSWLVEVGERRLFHAGDLNAWTWRDESTEAEVEEQMHLYRNVLGHITAWLDGRSVDFAFFPVDSRIGTGYAEGAREFVRSVDVKNFFPMHFCLGDAAEQEQRRRDALRLELYVNLLRGNYICLTRCGDTFATSDKK